jgi:hypothetical protein
LDRIDVAVRYRGHTVNMRETSFRYRDNAFGKHGGRATFGNRGLGQSRGWSQRLLSGREYMRMSFRYVYTVIKMT